MFDYFGVLISVILGLALTHLLRGFAKQIQMRHEVRPYWVHLVWTINVLIFVLAIWWGMFWWRGLQDWSAEWFYFIALYSVTLFMWSYMLYPPEFKGGLNFEDFFNSNRRWFFGLQLAVVLLDIPETLAKESAHLRSVPVLYRAFIPTLIIISLVGFFAKGRRINATLCVAWLIALLGYIFFSPISRIQGH